VDPTKLIREIGNRVKDGFSANRRLLAFDEYLALINAEPTLQCRSAAQYVRDMFDFYGTETISAFATEGTKYRLFDLAFEGGKDRVAGQEMVQQEIYKLLQNFIREGHVNKLILLHGPNGSAKSSLISCIMRGLAHYSQQDVGALYRFNWIFPTHRTVKGGIGFADTGADLSSLKSFAYLRDEQIDARMHCELKDHPLFLLPTGERQKVVQEALTAAPHGQDFVVADYIRYGNLCHKCKAIYEALLSAYQGDYLKVLRHVQVERFYLSRRYRESLVTVEPQLSVDAGLRQITMDRSAGALPTALQTLTLFEPHGELVDGNRGLLEFNDLLKRPLESFKYLLATSEKATVSLENCILFLDQVFIASSNEKHLDAFKGIPDFQSFKGRIELVKVPYILRSSVEQQIYDDQITAASVGKHLAPHTMSVVSRWAVMTRLMKPMAEKYPTPLKEILAKLSPQEKARLYDAGEVPDGLSTQQAKELRGHVAEIWRESRNYPNYEGRLGASPREIKTILLNAAQSRLYGCLSPLGVFEELEEFVRQRSVYEFLQQEVVGGFHDHARFIEDVRQEYLDTLESEVRTSTGLVEERLYEELFEKYVGHISHWIKKEKIRNRLTGAYEDPDEAFMGEIEGILAKPGEEQAAFRQGVISRIAAWRIEQPKEEVHYDQLFGKHLAQLRDSYYEKKKKQIQKLAEKMLDLLHGAESTLEPDERRDAAAMLARLKERFGYCDLCARDATAFLLKRRYQ
jgi:predicted Ser/Thr protein kinase